MTNVDPTTLAVVRGRLEQTTDEMDIVFERMAFSPVISDAWDRADGIYRPDNGMMPAANEVFQFCWNYAVRNPGRYRPRREAAAWRRLHDQ